jgi:DNA topoisomerase-1
MSRKARKAQWSTDKEPSMSNLMIIESPGKRKKLLEILGKLQPGVQWRIEASVGHIRDLPSKGLAEGHIVTGIKSDFTPTYELSERGAEIVAKLKKAAKEADNVYLATDPDREGESISWHLQQALGLKNPIRVSFNDISAPMVKAALASPGKIDVPMVAAQEARRVLDRLVGYMVSPELWRQTGEKLSAGRVQSPAVYLVVARERERRAFKKTDYFGVRLNFADAKTGNWRAEWATIPNFATKENPYFMDRRFADLVASIPRVRVVACDESEESRNPPAPFSTSTLQQAASNALRFNPKKAMTLAQSLYEQGHISYMRTDNPNIAEDSMPALREAAEGLGLEVVAERRVFKSKDGAQEGHPAITPTHWEVAEAGETDEERALYKLIRVRALASQLLAARFSARTVKLTGEVEGRTVDFETKGRTLIFEGWKKLLADDSTEEKPEGDDDSPNPIPKLEPGQVIDVAKGELLAKFTKAPPRYTEASLVKALESEGIGRPATYAAIMDNILGRAYVELEKRFLKPTVVGEQVVDALVGNFEFIELGFTSDLENDLDDIAKGKAAYRAVIQKLYSRLEKEIEAQKSKVPTFVKEVETFPCPSCKAPLRRIAKGANGPFWGCTKHPECSETLPDVGGKPGQKKPKVAVLSNFACAKCGKPLVERELTGKPGVKFWGCSGFKAGCKTAYPDKGGKPNYERAK